MVEIITLTVRIRVLFMFMHLPGCMTLGIVSLLDSNSMWHVLG